MKFLKKINYDSKQIIQDLRDLNDTLKNAVSEYQQVIFKLKEDIEMQREEIERLQKNEQIATEVIEESSAEIERLKVRNDELNALNKTASIEAIREFAERLCEGRVSNDPVVIAVKCELKEMVGDE